MIFYALYSKLFSFAGDGPAVAEIGCKVRSGGYRGCYSCRAKGKYRGNAMRWYVRKTNGVESDYDGGAPFPPANLQNDADDHKDDDDAESHDDDVEEDVESDSDHNHNNNNNNNNNDNNNDSNNNNNNNRAKPAKKKRKKKQRDPDVDNDDDNDQPEDGVAGNAEIYRHAYLGNILSL